jgi:hypothetical protein
MTTPCFELDGLKLTFHMCLLESATMTSVSD